MFLLSKIQARAERAVNRKNSVNVRIFAAGSDLVVTRIAFSFVIHLRTRFRRGFDGNCILLIGPRAQINRFATL
jgi:hypothetical protein